MDNISDLDELTLSARRREFEDGIFDLVLAAIFLVLALLNWLIFSFTGIRWVAEALLWNRELTIIGLLTLIPLFFLFIIALRRLADGARRKTIWSESGIVKPLRWQPASKTTVIATLVLLVLVVAALLLMTGEIIGPDIVLRTLVGAVGIASGISFYGMGIEIRLRRYRQVGAIGSLLSALLIFLPLSFAAAWLGLGLLWTVILGVSGGSAWRSAMAAQGERHG